MKHTILIAALVFFSLFTNLSPAAAADDLDIGKIYYQATTTHGTTTDTTIATYTLPYLLYKFFYALAAMCLLIVIIFYLIKIEKIL